MGLLKLRSKAGNFAVWMRRKGGERAGLADHPAEIINVGDVVQRH